MDPYVTEDEQLEALKNWWKSNGSSVMIGIVLGLTAVLGWQYWTSRQAAAAEQASRHYTALTQALQRSATEPARGEARVLLEEFADSAYGVLAALQLAKLDMDNNDTAAAAAHLEWALNHTDQEALKVIARLRLARLRLAEGRYQDAEQQLGQIQDVSFTAEVEALKGDIYWAQNALDKARLAYQTALAAGGGDALVRIKLENLPPPAAPAQE